MHIDICGQWYMKKYSKAVGLEQGFVWRPVHCKKGAVIHQCKFSHLVRSESTGKRRKFTIWGWLLRIGLVCKLEMAFSCRKLSSKLYRSVWRYNIQAVSSKTLLSDHAAKGTYSGMIWWINSWFSQKPISVHWSWSMYPMKMRKRISPGLKHTEVI